MFQYIPAQLQQVSTWYNDSLDTMGEFRPGYYLGMKADEGKLLLQTTSARSHNSPLWSANGWVICETPWLEFSLSGLSSGGELVWEETFRPCGYFGQSSTQQDIATETAVYCGKPVYYGHGILHYSPTEGNYILRVWEMGVLHEPCYSTNWLSGGVSGEYFFKSGLEDLTVWASWDDWEKVPQPFTMTLAGATEEAREGDYYNGYSVKGEVKLDGFWFYEGSPETSAQDEPPAGRYRNAKTGEIWEVGVKTYASEDGEGKRSIWKGARLNSTSPRYVSEDYGTLGYAANNADFGSCFWTGGRTATYVYRTSSRTLPDSFTLERYEKGDGDEWQAVASANLEMTLGPYITGEEENKVLMGEFTLWR